MPNAKRHLPRSSGSYFNTPEWRIAGLPEWGGGVAVNIGTTTLWDASPPTWGDYGDLK